MEFYNNLCIVRRNISTQWNRIKNIFFLQIWLLERNNEDLMSEGKVAADTVPQLNKLESNRIALFVRI